MNCPNCETMMQNLNGMEVCPECNYSEKERDHKIKKRRPRVKKNLEWREKIKRK
jgi:DNA-directed RNA polymerase subunit M/transcription elongation factor TFIIS